MTIRNAGRGTPRYNEGAIFKGQIRGIEETVRVEGDLAISGSQSKYILPLNDGTQGQVIETDGSGTLSWVTPEPTTFQSVPTVGALAKVVRYYDASPWEFIVCDAYNNDIVVRLPQASQATDTQICVKSAGPMNGHEVKLLTYLSLGNIDGSNQYIMTGDRESATIISDGSSWHIIAQVQ